MGEEGVMQCRSLLDGPHGNNNNSSEYLQQVTYLFFCMHLGVLDVKLVASPILFHQLIIFLLLFLNTNKNVGGM